MEPLTMPEPTAEQLSLSVIHKLERETVVLKTLLISRDAELAERDRQIAELHEAAQHARAARKRAPRKT